MENILVPEIDDDCRLSRYLEVKKIEKSKDDDIVEVSPCTSERGKVMAEIDLSQEDLDPFLDIDILCSLLESYEDHFAKMKCSTGLGVSRLMWKAHRIYIYENGKFKVRFAHDFEDALKTLESIGRLILGSIICEKCGLPAAECFLGRCGACLSKKSLQKLDLKEHFNGPIMARSVENLESAVKTARNQKHGDIFEGSSWPSTAEKKIRRRLEEAIEYAMTFSLETGKDSGSNAGAFFIALALKNLKFLDREKNLAEENEKPEKASKKLARVFEDVWKINENILEATQSEERAKENLEKNIENIHQNLEETKELFKNLNSKKETVERLVDLRNEIKYSEVLLENFEN